jgi:hypothetical protein
VLFAGIVAIMASSARFTLVPELGDRQPFTTVGILGVVFVCAGVIASTETAASYFRQVPTPSPLSFLLAIMFSSAGAVVQTLCVMKAHHCTFKQTLPHFFYWLCYCPVTLAMAWIRGVNGSLLFA